MVVCENPASEVLNLIADEAASRPQLPVIVVCGGSPNGFVRQVFEAGAADISSPTRCAARARACLFALEKALARKHAAAPEAHTVGKLIAGARAEGRHRQDADLVRTWRSRWPRPASASPWSTSTCSSATSGWRWASSPSGRSTTSPPPAATLDTEKVEDYLTPHESGVEVLLAPLRPDQAERVDVDFLRELFALLRREHDYIVVDTPPGFSPEVIATIDASSSMCMVGMLDAPSLKNTKIGLETLDLMGYPTRPHPLVLNRADTSVGISTPTSSAILGRAPGRPRPEPARHRAVDQRRRADRPRPASAPRRPRRSRPCAELFCADRRACSASPAAAGRRRCG